MDFVVSDIKQRRRLFEFMADKIYRSSDFMAVRYLELTGYCVRVIIFSEEVLQQIEQHLSYVLRMTAAKYDATVVIFKEVNTVSFWAEASEQFDLRRSQKLRLDFVFARGFYLNFLTDNRVSSSFMTVDNNRGLINAYDEEHNTVYFGARDLRPEEFIKYGHALIKPLYRFSSLPNRHLVHGAAVGVNGTGALICARGQRGKSTLTVNALLHGFDYVADDYLLLDREGDKLFASPIYSIITLSPYMYQRMYNDFKGKFVSTNARFNKYVFNIEAYHKQFKEHYPIKVCLFPNICADKEPSIVPFKKGRAIAQMIHSTINQNSDDYHTKTVKKLVDFLMPFEFYQINLCLDIDKNTQCLYDFLKTYKGKNNDCLCIK